MIERLSTKTNKNGNRNDRAIIYCEYNWTRDGRAI